jgi:hypothetical protein
MKEHMASFHKMEVKNHKVSALWGESTLQTYFTGNGRIDYFVVVNGR